MTVPCSECVGHLVVFAEGGDEDEALDARSGRLDNPSRLCVKVASQVRVDDALTENGSIELLPVEDIAFHGSRVLRRICEIARVTQGR